MTNYNNFTEVGIQNQEGGSVHKLSALEELEE
jgi:hypothetical protein